MGHKRVTLFAGHYGSGKTNLAVNWALNLKDEGYKVAVADLDIVNPYFRSKDDEAELTEAGVKLICSQYANTNVDVPALPQELYSIVDDKTTHVVIDVGGDDRGALALGRISPALVEENDYEMIFVINKFRPLTQDAKSTFEVMREIEVASGIKCTAIINNSNLGRETDEEDVLGSIEYAKECEKLCGIPLKATAVEESLFEKLQDKVENLMPIHIRRKYKWN